MLGRNSVRVAVLFTSFLTVSLLVGTRPAQADSFQITLDGLTFQSPFGAEVFNGSFQFDSTTGAITSVDVLATGATDSVFGQPLQFGADITGNEPFAFAFDDGLGIPADQLVLNLPLGLLQSNYDFSNAILFGVGPLGSLGFDFQETASSGFFSVNGAAVVPTPEGSSVSLLLIGVVLVFGCMIRSRRERHSNAE